MGKKRKLLFLMKNEINDLYTYDYKIVQNQKYFKFSLDSILLAEFVNFNYSDKKMLDMCTGNCPVPIILSSKIKNIVAIEVQEEIYKMGKESIEINDIHNIDRITINTYIRTLREKKYAPWCIY